MTRAITIVVETIESEAIKSVTVEIDGKKKDEFYSYPEATTDATIEAEVNADLDTKGYPE